MTWLDGQIDLIVTNQTPGLITVWNRNPNTFALEGYGVTYDSMSPVLKEGVRQWLGPPPPPPPVTYGATNKTYAVRLTCSDNGSNRLYDGPYSGKMRVENSVGVLFNSGTQKGWTVTVRGGVDNPGGTGTVDLTINCGPSSTAPLVEFLEYPNLTPAAPAGGGYPTLTPAELSTVQVFFSAVRSVAASGTGIRPEVIAQLTAQVEEVKQSQVRIEPKIEETRTGVGELGPPLAEVQLGNAAILLKLEDILDCTCRLVVEDCDGDDRVGLKEALKVIIGVVCDLQKKLGFTPGTIQVPGNQPKTLRTVRESLADIMRRVGYDGEVREISCGQEVVVKNVQDHETLLLDVIGYSNGIPTGVFNSLGEEEVICTVANTLARVLDNPGELSVYRGVEVDSLPVRILKIHYNEGQKYRKQAGMQIPNPDIGVTRAEILAALGPKVSGEWLCQLTFTSGRKLLGWFDSEESGLDYLDRASTLSGDVVVVGSGAATHNPADSPTRYSGVTLSPTVAFVVPTTAEGTLSRRIPLV